MQRRTFLKAAAMGVSAFLADQTGLTASAAPTPFSVYLTFDNAPSSKSDLSGTTADILNTLKKYKAAATFFVRGHNLHDYDSALLSQMLADGHAIGNGLWQDQGNTAADQSASSLLAEQYLKTEKKIRALIQQSNADAASAYDAQAKLYRRPGGDTVLAAFLDPVNYDGLTHEPYLKNYADVLEWIKSVYDYSGWHVGAGQATKKAKKLAAFTLMRQIVNGSKDVQGVLAFLCVAANKKRALETAQGLVIQMFDGDKLTPQALPQIILQLRAKGAEFHVLPRSKDKPNAITLGVEDPPTVDDNGVMCGA